MTKYKTMLAGLGLALTLSLTSTAFALAPSPDSRNETVRLLNEGRTTRAPMAFMLFCMKDPQECRGGGAARVNMTAELMTALKRTNASVNRSIRPVNDKGDIWSINVSRGDCEDFVLTKRSKLIAMGVPAGALRIAIGHTRWGEGHAVLVVRTKSGDYVLDNRSSAIKQWHETDIRWVAISGANPQRWHNV